MSLDVYLKLPQGRAGTGIFIRENGARREISREEFDARFPGAEPAVVDMSESDEVYSRNITHNLTSMAEAAGLYEALWHPAELDPAMAARIRAQVAAKNYHGVGGAYELESGVTVYARDLIAPLEKGLALLRSDPARFERFNPANGWGNYAGLVDFVTEYLAACQRYPDALVRVSR